MTKGIQGMTINQGICPGKSAQGLIDNPDIQHLEGIEQFNRPMQDYFRMADELSKVFIINLGIKFGIFDAIFELGSCATPLDIINKLNIKTSTRHMIDFLDQLYIHGLLNREGLLEKAKYSLTDYSGKYLLKSSPTHFHDVFLNLDRYIRRYQKLEGNFPGGKTEHIFDDVYSNDEDLRCYMEYFYKSNEFNFNYLLDRIDFSKYQRVIDIHGLTGCLAMKLKKRYPTCDVVSFENSKLKSLAENKVQGLGMQDAIKLECGDFRNKGAFSTLFGGKAGLKTDCDCVIAPHILMQFNCENRKKVLESVFECLRLNGDLIIMENLIDENRSKDSCGLKISFMLSAMGYEGFESSFSEYKCMLSEAGFEDIQHIPQHQGLSDIIIARKLRETKQ